MVSSTAKPCKLPAVAHRAKIQVLLTLSIPTTPGMYPPKNIAPVPSNPEDDHVQPRRALQERGPRRRHGRHKQRYHRHQQLRPILFYPLRRIRSWSASQAGRGPGWAKAKSLHGPVNSLIPSPWRPPSPFTPTKEDDMLTTG